MLVQPCETSRCPWSSTDHGAAWMYCPPQVSRWVQETVAVYESPGSLDEKISDSFLVITTMFPLDEGLLGLPRLTGTVLSTWSFWLTVIMCVASSVTMVSLSPMEASMVRSLAPYEPPSNGSPPVAIRTDSLVPAAQRSLDR